MKLSCWLGFHSWKRVGVTMPIREVSDFVERRYIGHLAMGECRNCGIQRLQGVTGYWQWYHSDEKTIDQYNTLFEAGEYKLDENDELT